MNLFSNDKEMTKAEKLWRTARIAVGLIVVLTVLNSILLIAGGEDVFCFSNSLCYLNVYAAITMQGKLYLAAAVFLSLLTLTPYIVGFFVTKNHGGYMVAILVLWCVDTFIGLLLFDIPGLIIHILGIVLFARTVKVRRSVFAPAGDHAQAGAAASAPVCPPAASYAAPEAPAKESRTCSACGAPLGKGDAVCPYCGTPAE